MSTANQPSLISEVTKALGPLMGLKLSISRNAADMKVLHFGEIKPHPDSGTMGDFALHIQCPWRIVTSDRVITGSHDYHEPADPKEDWDAWEPSRPRNRLQDKRLLELFPQYDPGTKSLVNATALLVVDEVEADIFGGIDLHLSGGYRLQIFPVSTSESSSWGEQWRFFKPFAQHFVVVANGGRARVQDDA